MTKIATVGDSERLEFLVLKLLGLISDKAMRAGAEKCFTQPRTFVVECNFLDEVLDDPRVQRRLQALNSQGIEITPRDATNEVAGNTYTRRQLAVQF